jgi:hypothetical protein
MRVVFLAALTLLAACAPLSIYHRAGTPVAQMQSDTVDCEVSALRQVPVATQVRREPPEFVPPRQVCDSAGNCYTRPGYWIEGAIYTVDANEGLRARVQDQCMIAKGYAPVTLPVCSQAVAQSVPVARTVTLPPLGPNACVVRNQGGTWQIVP